jgi:hypothetical protein
LRLRRLGAPDPSPEAKRQALLRTGFFSGIDPEI